MVTFDSPHLNPAFAAILPYKDSDLHDVIQIGLTPQASPQSGPPYRLRRCRGRRQETAGQDHHGRAGRRQSVVRMNADQERDDSTSTLGSPTRRRAAQPYFLAGFTAIAIQRHRLIQFPHVRAKNLRPMRHRVISARPRCDNLT